ncbi:uncharacterized protein [Apostichopus japonicus]|uniref:uncharacterized protein isoform X2 n=1 Tax=Stichopus japonicus TaxID=307972 RepID=UPI003AB14F0A
MELGYLIPASEERYLIANDSTKREKWPVSFWIILKILGMTDSKVVDDTWKCLKCRVCGLRANKRDTFHNRTQLDNSNVRNNSVTCNDNDETQPLLNQQDKNEECDVCDTLWWDFHRQTVKYNERDIGAKVWCHYRSGVMSSVMLSILLAINAYYLGLTLYTTWADSKQLLHFINQFPLIVCLSFYPFVVLCSKLDYYPCLFWTRTFNIRYIAKRAQYVDWKHTGLPGKPFLILCIIWPILVATYRTYIMMLHDQCKTPTKVNTVFSCVYCFVMLITWCLFAYIIYFIRRSFHRQFRILLLYINDYQGQIDRCRDTLHNVLTEFNCFRRFCNIYVMCMLPVLILGIVTNITWQYTLFDDWSKKSDATSIQLHFDYLGWNLILMGFTLGVIAIGGFDVKYICDEFYSNILQLQSERYPKFWKEIIHQISIVSKESNGIVISVLCAVLGSYMTLHLQDQDTSFFC